MKIAICLSGAPRFQDLGFFKQLEAMKGDWEADLFIRIWKTDQFGNTPEEFQNYLKNNGLPDRCTFRVTDILDDIPENNSPPINLTYGCPTLNGKNIINAWYGINKINNARKQYQEQSNTKYDLVFRMRTDCCPFFNVHQNVPGYFNLNDYLEIAKTNSVHSKDWAHPYPSDCYFFGSPEIFDRVVAYYDFMRELERRGNSILPEQSLQTYLQEKQIPFTFLNLIMNPMQRSNEYGSRFKK